jgi:hypothetical protein
MMKVDQKIRDFCAAFKREFDENPSFRDIASAGFIELKSGVEADGQVESFLRDLESEGLIERKHNARHSIGAWDTGLEMIGNGR